MPRSRSPLGYSDTFYDVLQFAVEARPTIRVACKRNPREHRLRFYAFRNAWEREAQRAFEQQNPQQYEIARQNYEALMRYEVIAYSDCVIYRHRALDKEEVTAAEGAVDDVDFAPLLRPVLTLKEDKRLKKKGPVLYATPEMVTRGQEAAKRVEELYTLTDEERERVHRQAVESKGDTEAEGEEDLSLPEVPSDPPA